MMLIDLNAASMLANIASATPNLMRLVTSIAYVLGMTSIMKGVMEFKHYGETRSMYSTKEYGMIGPLVYLATGAALLYFPTAVQVGMSTFWIDPNPYGYLQQEGQWKNFINDCVTIIQFVGTIAFLKGLLNMNRLGNGSGGQGLFSKGLTHMIGGIFCINIYQFIQVILATLGIQI